MRNFLSLPLRASADNIDAAGKKYSLMISSCHYNVPPSSAHTRQLICYPFLPVPDQIILWSEAHLLPAAAHQQFLLISQSFSFVSAMKSLKNTSSPLHQYYRQMLSEAVKENKESLESVGITQEKDGSLKLDQNKMEAAGTDALEQALGGVFSEKLSFLADRIADNAKANADSASNQ